MSRSPLPPSLDLLAIGESMIVLVPEDGDRLETAARVSLHAAGAESNVVHYLAQRGHRVGWLGRLGDDPFGRRLLREFQGWGIDVSQAMLVPDEPTGVYFKDAGTSHSVHYYRRGSAASAMAFSDVAQALRRTDRIHLSGITAALGEGCATMLRELLTAARAVGVPVSFDVNFRPALWSATDAAPMLAEFAELADLVFVGRDEAESLWGTRTPEEIRGLLRGVPELVVKDAAVGATVFAGERPAVFQSTPRADVVELVGAGDAFAAGYLSGLIDGASLIRRLRLGHVFAGTAISSTADTAVLPDPGAIARMVDVSEGAWRARGDAATMRS